MRQYVYTWRVRAVVLAFCLAGCNDFAQTRSGVRRDSDAGDAPPQAAAALHIPNPPSVTPIMPNDNVKQAAFAQAAEKPRLPPIDPNDNPMGALYRRAAQRYALMDSYTFRLKRREVVAGRKQPEELLRVHVRREPFSVHLVWLGKEGKGREAIYVQGKYKNEMQLLLAAGDIPFFAAGMRFSIAPDDPLARAKARHPITETGFGSLIDSYGRMVAGVEKGDARQGKANYLGRVKRPEFEQPVEAVHQVLPAGSDPLLPKGGERWWYFDPTSGLPLLYITHDPSGEVEYYCHDHVIWPSPMDDNDFDPNRVWRK